MLDYQTTQATLHTRGINIDEKQYLFVLQVVMGEYPPVAYAIIYDTTRFKREINGEGGSDYLSDIKKEADARLQQQEERQIKELLEADFRSEVQTRAMNLKDYQFTTGQVIQILQNLLHNRVSDLESSSVKDIISLINTLASQGAIQSGDNFESHFIHILPHFTSMCIKCNREFDVIRGMDCVCPHCHHVYKWSEEEGRFYPQPSSL
mgnify:CR=1 FL=1